MADTIVLEVTRYSPDRDAPPHCQSYEVPFHKDWVVLDALNYIKDKLDGTLAFRWSCRMGICGSCGMMVDGEPKLTCATFLTDYAPGPLRIEPLRYFPVMRDLVVDISDFMIKFKKVKPWLIRQEEKPVAQGEYLQTPAQLDAYKQFSMCINCMLCYAACPVYGLDPHFAGPAAIALAQRYNRDSRDQGASERTDLLSQEEGIWACTFVGECSAVCPKHVDPAGAIQQYKVAATLELVPILFDAMEREITEAPVPPGRSLQWHHPRMSTWWWLTRWVFLKFILRELSSLFVACFVVQLLLFVRALSAGPEAYARFQQCLQQPWVILLNLASFGFVLVHAITWFNLAPKAMPVRLQGKRVPDALVAGANYAAWLGVSAWLAWMILKG